MAYTSGLFRPPAELAGDNWACLMLAIPPGLRAAYLTPVDGGLWLVTMYGRGGDMAPRDPEGFVEWARGLAHPSIYEKTCKSRIGLRAKKLQNSTWKVVSIRPYATISGGLDTHGRSVDRKYSSNPSVIESTG